MRAMGSYRRSLVVVLAGALGTIGADQPRVAGEAKDVPRLTTARTIPRSSDAAPQAVKRSEEGPSVSRRADEFDRVRAVARASGSVRVIVQLDVPNLKALTSASHAAKGPAPITAADRQLSAAIAGVRQVELGKLAGTPHTINRTYASVPFVAMTVSERALDVLRASPGVLGINEDRLAAPLLNNTVNITGASAAWSQGFDGSGWYVAILDTGIRATHHFFAGKDIVQACFSLGEDGAPGAGGCPNGQSEDTTSPNAARHFPTSPTSDHGTHVSGIATGNDPTRVPPLYGIARGADIIAIQVFSQFSSACGGFPCLLSYSSDQIAGLDYVFSLRSTHNIASVNMSLGGGFYDNQAACDADNAGVKAAIDNLRGVGTATVIASGNDGFCDGISGPGCISTAVGVGATDDSDFEAWFSNFHPTLLDIYAPGVDILSSVGVSDSSYDGTWSGTSMAAPHVAGAWAILKQADPGEGVSDILTALQNTGDPVSGRCVPSPTQRRIRIDLALGEGQRIKFDQHADGTGETIASDIDWTDMTPNVVVADDFVSDGRPINSVRWWGSNIPPGPTDPKACDNPVTCDVTTACTGDPNCSCYKRPDGSGVCGQVSACSFLCPNGDVDCPEGTKCVVETCCGDPVCVPNCPPPAGVCAADNGGFETGVFSPWVATTNGLGEFCPWTVSGPGGCWFATAPFAGAFDAWNGFDGEAGLYYSLSQDVVIPAATSVTLTTHHRIQYDSLGIPSTLPRVFNIGIQTPSTGVALYHEEVLLNGANYTDLGWNTQVFDITPWVNAGETISISFSEDILETYTGPGTIEFDEITLSCSTPAGATQSTSIALGPARADSDNAPWITGLDRDTLRQEYLRRRDEARLHAGDTVTRVVAVERARPTDSRSGLMASGGMTERTSKSSPRATPGGQYPPASTSPSWGRTAQSTKKRVGTPTANYRAARPESEPVAVTYPPPPEPTVGGPGCIVLNGDFETGTLAGWTMTDSTGNGFWAINDGSYIPASGDGPFPPCAGSFSAITDQVGYGIRTLYQDVTIPAAASATLRWTDMIRNHNGAFVDPGQEFRVQVRNPADNSVLATLFSTNPGDSALQSCTSRCSDISAFIGQTVRITFEEEDNLYYFNVHVDDVCVVLNTSCPTGACCLAGPNCLQNQTAIACASQGGIYQGDGTTTCTNCPPPPCDVTCDAGAIPENEPDCGVPVDTVNGGCNSDPPVFTPITCGDTFCGTGAFDGSTRDTDWYKLVLGAPTTVTWTVTAEFQALVGIIETGGVDTCPVGAFRAATFLAPCTTGSVSDLLPAGTWYLFVAPDFAALVTCGAEYNAALTCGPAPVCGNGIVEAGEECDPPDGVTCNALCQYVTCGDGVVEGNEQCDPPDGLFCDGNCRTIFNPPIDGWMISFHEPLAKGGSPSEALGLYFCDANAVTVRATSLGSCDARQVREYTVNLANCCLVRAKVDSRSGQTPAQPDAFHEQTGFAYDIDIQAVVGFKYVPEVDPKACDNPVTCDVATACTGDPNCSCYKRPDGSGVCGQASACSFLCPNGDVDCPEGTKCVVETCCGDPVCVPNCPGLPPLASAARYGEAQQSGRMSSLPSSGDAVPSIPTTVVQAGPEGNVPEGTLGVRYIGDGVPSQGGNVADAVAAFPSAASTVIAELGFIDATQVGYFWSAARGDSVTETFATGESTIGRAIFDFVVPTNFLNSGAFVHWDVLINGLVIGSFTVVEGQVGPVHLDFSFTPLPGPGYAVQFRVTNEVPVGLGSHSLGYAGPDAGTVRLLGNIGGSCMLVPTGNTATTPFWGWQTTGIENGARSALQSMVSTLGPDWLYGPWANITPTCSQPNMAFQLLTDTIDECRPPPSPTNPSPSDGAVNVLVDTDLAWNGGAEGVGAIALRPPSTWPSVAPLTGAEAERWAALRDLDMGSASNPGALSESVHASPIRGVSARIGGTVLDAVNRGWWRDDGFHDSANGNTYTGQNGGGTELFNSYFIFDVSGAGSVTGATLRLEIEAYFGPDASETLTVYNVSTDAAVLEASGVDVGIYNDLMTGTAYATFTVTPGDVGTVMEIPLNAAAVADINAAGAFFSVGLHVRDIGLPSGDEGVRFSWFEEPRTHQLVLNEGGTCPTTYDVYFGTDPAALGVICAGVDVPTCDPGTLSEGRTYYWQVVAANCCGRTAGPVWSFTTEGCPPPPVPANPSPSDGAIDVPVDADLAWNGAPPPGQCVVIPNDRATTEGDSANSIPFYSVPGTVYRRYQQVYDSAEVGGSGVITEIRFRPDTDFGDPFGPTSHNVEVYLGHAATTVATASPVFADNVGPGYTLVYSGLLSLSSQDIGSPAAFDIVIDVDDVFSYNMGLGDLLLEVKVLVTDTATYFDATGGAEPQTATTRIFALNVDDQTGELDGSPYGLVTMFCFEGGTPAIVGGATKATAIPRGPGPVYEIDPSTGVARVVGPADASRSFVALGGQYAAVRDGASAQEASRRIARRDSAVGGVQNSSLDWVPMGPASSAHRADRAGKSSGKVLSTAFSDTALEAPRHVAIFEDQLPWGSTANEDTLIANGIPFDVFSSSDMGVVDLSPYDKVIIASVQPQSFYAALEANRAWFEVYVSSGGVLDLHLASQPDASADGRPLPGGFVLSIVLGFDDVTIVDPAHPITTTPNPIGNADVDGWNWSTHGYFVTFPAAAHEIIEIAGSGEPCCMDLPFGAGRILATVQTVEWGGGSPAFLENTILYGMSAGCQTTYDVSLWTDLLPPALICDDVAVPTCDPGTLAPATTYHWQVVATNSSRSTAGPVWSFTTACTGTVDANGDGHVDLADLQELVASLYGPGSPGGDDCLDFDGDGDTDLADFAKFQRLFTGALQQGK